VFSGIVETLGDAQTGEDGRLHVTPRTSFTGLRVGESIAVNGTCLTIAAVTPAGFSADVMPETLGRTTLGGLDARGPVNLERALRIGDRIGGHMLTGHIDATGVVSALREDGNARWVTVSATDSVTDLIAEKGCIAVDGISLTVVDVFDSAFTVSLIPVTLRDTTAGGWAVGTRVNLEVDLIARYVARALTPRERIPVFAAARGGE
jgi:riboflavin synthase